MATKTIGLSGRDYSTLSAWASYVSALALSAPEVAEVYNDSGPVADTASLIVGGWTGASSTNTVTLRPATGQGFKDHASAATNAVRWDSSNGAAFTTSSYNDATGAYRFTGDWLIVQDLQFKLTTSNSGLFRAASSNNQTFKNLILETNSGGGKNAVTATSAGSFENIAVICTGAVAVGVSLQSSNSTWIGCTVLHSGTASGDGFQIYAGGSPVLKNCVSYGFTNDYTGTYSASSTNNATDKGSFGGTNVGTSGQTSVVSGDFVSVTNGSENVRVASGSTKLKDNGATVGSGTDLLGVTRSAPYDIGAVEYTVVVMSTVAPPSRAFPFPILHH